MNDFSVCPHGPCAPALEAKDQKLHALRAHAQKAVTLLESERESVGIQAAICELREGLGSASDSVKA